MWGDPESITKKLMKHRLKWLGHLVGMEDYRIPKRTLFAWSPQKRPPAWWATEKIEGYRLGRSEDGWSLGYLVHLSTPWEYVE